MKYQDFKVQSQTREGSRAGLTSWIALSFQVMLNGNNEQEIYNSL